MFPRTAAIVGVLSIVIPITLSGVFFLLWNRNHVSIASRDLPLMLSSMLSGLVIMIIGASAFITSDFTPVSCHLHLWTSSLFVPMFGAPYLFRAYILYFNYAWRTNASGRRLSVVLESSWFKFLRKSDTRFTFGMYFALILVTIVLTGIGFRTSGIDPTTYYMPTVDCIPRFHRILVALQAATFLVVVVIAFWKLFRVKDAFAFKLELLVSCCVGFPVFVMWVIARLVVSLNSLIPDGIWGIIIFLVCVITTVAIPMVHVYKTRGHMPHGDSGSFLGMEVLPHVSSNADFLLLVLDSPPLLKSLQQFMVTTWSVENMLILLEIRQLQGSKMTLEELQTEATRIYDLFLAPKSMFEVNLDSEDRERIMEVVVAKQVTSDSFEAVKIKVFNIIKHDSLPRWRLTPEFEAAWKQHIVQG